MSIYDYKAGKKRIQAILDNQLEVIEQDKLPKDEEFTFDNGYYSWVTAIFVDIRKSSKLFANEDKEIVSKIIRSFTSEIIEILRDDDNLREIGIRGDCVYAIYTSPKMNDEYNLADKTFYINTFMKMLNNLLENAEFDTIKAGIGMSTAKELVVKAGRKDVGINNKVWIGDAVTKASNLSSLGNKNGLNAVLLSSSSYDNIIDKLVEEYGDTAKSWFTKHTSPNYGTYYESKVTIIDFNDWINEGMKD